MPETFKIRFAKESDILDLITLEFGQQGETNKPSSIPDRARQFTENIKSYLIAEKNGKIIGYQGHSHDYPIIYSKGKKTIKKSGILLHDTYTVPASRNKGVAGKLFNRMIRHVETKNPNTTLYVSTKHEHLGDTFKKAGFTEVGSCKSCPSGHMEFCSGKMFRKVAKK